MLNRTTYIFVEIPSSPRTSPKNNPKRSTLLNIYNYSVTSSMPTPVQYWLASLLTRLLVSIKEQIQHLASQAISLSLPKQPKMSMPPPREQAPSQNSGPILPNLRSNGCPDTDPDLVELVECMSGSQCVRDHSNASWCDEVGYQIEVAL